MKITIRRLRLILPIFCFLLLLACSKNDDNGGTADDDQTEQEKPNIVALAESVNILSYLVDALGTVDESIANALSSEGSFTVFAPTNDAFRALFSELEGIDGISDFDQEAEKMVLAEILKYHVVDGMSAFSNSLTNGKTLTTLQSEDISIVVDGSVFVADKTEINAEVLNADNEASNGVVHIIDKVMLSDAALAQLFPRPTIGELIAETETLSLLREAVEKAGLTEDLNGDGPLTVFAPSNEAIQGLFDQLGDNFSGLDDFDNAIEMQILKNLLLYHVVDNNLASTDLQAGTLATLLEDEFIEIIPSGDSFVVGDASDENANFIAVDNEASNGTVHIVDKILVPQFVVDFLNDNDTPPSSLTIAQLVRESDEFSLLREALELTGLLETLDSQGPFTVFAPTNESFSQLLLLLGAGFTGIEDFDTQLEIDLLRSILAYHVVQTSLVSDDFSDQTLNTLSDGDQLHLESRDGAFVLLDVTRLPVSFVANDFMADNGIIHAVDRILLPPSLIDTVLDIAEDSLISLLMELDLELDLRTVLGLAAAFTNQVADSLEDDFTLFLPTAHAFNDLLRSLQGGFDSLEDFINAQNLNTLITILEYHCVPDVRLTSGDLRDELVLSTFLGAYLEVDLVGDTVFILDATNTPSKVVNADNLILDGVVHIVDKVLIPAEVLNKL